MQMTGTTPREKGNSLENAVRAIESAILRSFPGYSESAFRIEGKKTLVTAGVRHEIDIHVTVSVGVGYDAVFIFECKNWQEKVGKNDIIIFAEKVRVFNAQRGFFVAKSYTMDAEAQATLDPRIELLLAAELDPSGVMVPAGFHGIQVGETNAYVNMHCTRTVAESAEVPVDLEMASFVLDGTPINLKGYITAWIKQLSENRCNHFPSVGACEGMHVLEFSEERTFKSGQAVVNGHPVKSLELKGTVKVHVSKAVVISVFEVATRGRVITVQVDTPIASVRAEFVQLPTDAKS